MNALLDETNDIPVIELDKLGQFEFESDSNGLKTSPGPSIIACDRRFELLVVGIDFRTF